MPVDISKKLFFIHIPKTGGSSVEKALHLHPHQVSDAEEFLSGTNKHLQHLTYNEASKRIKTEVFQKLNSFCIVRNPVDRFYSEFNWRKKIKHPLVNDMSVLDFAEYLMQMKLSEKLEYECHFRLQSDYFYNENQRINSVKVFRLENGMNEVKEWLYGTLNIDIDIPHENKTNSKSNLKSQYIDDLVKEIYKDDFEKLGY